ncbi:DUF551 domain-containing protein [Klebsiella aerogenes]
MTNNQLTDQRIAEILARAEICDDSVLTDYADIAAAMRELQERRKADSEPYSEITLRLTRLDVLETILRNELGLPCESPIPDIAEKIYDMKRSRIYSVVPDERPSLNNGIVGFDEGWNACRAAMLQAEPVTSANKLGNSPAQSPIDHGYRPGCECSGCKTTVRICAELAGWIPVSERLPEEGGRYWCYVEEQNSLGKSHYQWNCSWNGEIWGGAMMYGRVTHWMPLPAAPQEVKNV